jgi:hypothetical protein
MGEHGVVFVEDWIDSGGFISHAQEDSGGFISHGVVKLPGSNQSGIGEASMRVR